MPDTQGYITAVIISDNEGKITQEGDVGHIQLTFQQPPSNAQGLYTMPDGPEWYIIPDAGIVLPLNPGESITVQVQRDGYQAFGCRLVSPESSAHAAFEFSWLESNGWPSVIVEVQEVDIGEG